MVIWRAMLLDHLTGVLEYLQGGGSVMVPLTIVSVWMWALIFRKLHQLYRFNREEGSAAICPGFLQAASGDARRSVPKGWRADILQTFLSRRSHDAKSDRSLLAGLVKRQSAALENHVRTILVLASAAPLLGLLGTVTGMIRTFDAISRLGTGNAKALAGGISEALITTQSGLVIAIPGLLMGGFILRRVKRCQARMDRFALALGRELDSGER